MSTGSPLSVQPILPFTVPSFDHLDQRVSWAAKRALTVEGLRPATTARWIVAYRSFRRFVSTIPSGHVFLGGDARAQKTILEGWIAWMRSGGFSRNGLATYWRGLGAVLSRIGGDAGMLNPVVLVPAPRENLPHPAFLTRERGEALLRHLGSIPGQSRLARTRNRCLVGLMMLSGLRRQETLDLLLADVDTEQRTIHVRAGKGRNGGRDRTAYMNPELVVLVKEYLAERKRCRRSHSAFLTSLAGDAPAGRMAIRRLFERASRALGAHITPHQLRHTYATLLRQSGVADRVAMELLGHRSPAMLHRYSHVLDDEPAREAARLHVRIDS